MSDPSRRDFLQSSAMAVLLAGATAPTPLKAADARAVVAGGAFDF